MIPASKWFLDEVTFGPDYDGHPKICIRFKSGERTIAKCTKWEGQLDMPGVLAGFDALVAWFKEDAHEGRLRGD